MNLPVTYIFPPAQELTVRIAVPALEPTRRRQAPAAEANGGKAAEFCALRNKYRARPKYRRMAPEIRAVLEVETP